MEISFAQLLNFFDGDSSKASNFNPHLNSMLKHNVGKIPAGTVLYLPNHWGEVAHKDLPKLVRKI